MSIATKQGDDGTTGLIGGRRISKGDLRIEALGVIDELGAQMGFSRSLCSHEETRTLIKALQQELFVLSEAMASDPQSAVSPAARLDATHVEALTAQVHRLERVDGILLDWAIPGEQTAAAALDVARTTCRRAERTVVRLSEAGEVCDKNMVAYLNRLADLLWLLSRFLERDVAADARLRADKHDPARWSRAW